MSPKQDRDRSVSQRVANRGRALQLSRKDMFTAYAMDRLLYRLGRSKHVKEFYLKGGVLVANLLDAPHRFTRDIDFLRKRGPAKPDDIRRKFQDIASVKAEDGVLFEPNQVRAEIARREVDGYDGVRGWIGGQVGQTEIELKVDIGFGDALVPSARRTSLSPFLVEEPRAEVYAYQVETVLAEKIQTVVSKWPAIEHRLKDILDVVALSEAARFVRDDLLAALRATFGRRGTVPEVEVLDDMRAELKRKKWETEWATMCKEKAVLSQISLQAALEGFERFVRPLLVAMAEDHTAR